MNNQFLKKISGLSITANNHLALNDVDLVEVSKLSDRPIYVFNELAIRENIRSYQRSLELFYPKPSSLFYASKAFLNLAISSLLCQEEIGIDVCSEGELYIALKANIPPSHIIMHGNNKSEKELRLAIESQVNCIIVDNKDELFLLDKICSETKIPCNILLRINPDVHVSTHKHMDTATKESKFGFYADREKIPEYLKNISTNPYITFKGIHCHIGSNIRDIDNYTSAIEVVIDYLSSLNKEGIKTEVLNMGGGLGVPYNEKDPVLDIPPFVQTICQTIIAACKKKNIELPDLMLEPGRSIVGLAGCTLYKIGSIKEGPEGVFYAAINGGMSDNIRPSLYQAAHTAVIANKMNWQNETYSYKIVGKCCETGDVLINNISLPFCKAGDVLVVFSTGAYNHSLANNYNKHTIPGVVFIRDGQYDWVSKEQNLEDLIQYDLLPTHLT